jgi:hypothetical protein
MQVQDMFRGDRYGRVKDPYGYEWQIATHTEDLTPKQIDRRAGRMGHGPRLKRGTSAAGGRSNPPG